MTDFEMLERITEKAAEPMAAGNGDKTLGQWRHEMQQLMTEAIFYVAARRNEQSVARGDK